ncbi:PREDICTED: calponin homology domain-containing protein DDB_G0272472 isoform X2 [Nelumbo nucifera]|uniref:Calponin homology domain-containing protein DDB_G0272472 isoform X2 n=1 Tax=Nelumbo nucifera TaxID=4432 RepID=A0A1U8QAJ4_NELNU|nr:PREDICTED: calponin homology domain-containing protein DDB_G0272472 isoform X2 [Nelumbo nucifera]
MDLGCLDLGCISVLDKQNNDFLVDSDRKDGDVEDSATATGKNRVSKDIGQTLNAVNKSTSHIKKPPHRRNSSPLNWFPRKKTDSYLNRKIKLLQEIGGMNSTLDETLGNSNLHYCRVEREKIAAREAAQRVMEARKAAMVEASWCRILRAARIQSKEAEAFLLKAEKGVVEAFEAAKAMGVIMYERQDCPWKPCEIESSSVNKGGSTTHTVTASFETAFEVDKEVAAAVKTALIRLAHCPSSLTKDDIKDLLWKISQNPDTNETNQELSEFSSECEADNDSGLDSGSQEDGVVSQCSNSKIPGTKLRQRKSKNKQISPNINTTKLVDLMLNRLKCLQEDELASLATIVATCGLNAALLEVENSKQQNPEFGTETMAPIVTFGRNTGVFRRSNMEHVMDREIRRKQVVTELPSLDKFLVKHMSKLEREVEEAKNMRNSECKEGCRNNPQGSEDTADNSNRTITSSEAITDLGSILLKHSSKLQKEIEEEKKKLATESGVNDKKGNKQDRLIQQRKKDVSDVPSLDKFLVKHVSRLEREVQDARNMRKTDQLVGGNSKVNDKSLALPKVVKELDDTVGQAGKENIDSNESVEKLELLSSLQGGNGIKETDNGLDKILVKPVHRLEREKMQALALGMDYVKRKQKKQGSSDATDCESLDKVLAKHVPRLEKEKMGLGVREEVIILKRRREPELEKSEGGLDQILVKHQSRLEKEKLAATQQSGGDHTKHLEARREARERELQEAWGGLSLGNSIRPRLSRLERDKAAWIKAEEEEQKQSRAEL